MFYLDFLFSGNFLQSGWQTKTSTEWLIFFHCWSKQAQHRQSQFPGLVRICNPIKICPQKKSSHFFQQYQLTRWQVFFTELDFNVWSQLHFLTLTTNYDWGYVLKEWTMVSGGMELWVHAWRSQVGIGVVASINSHSATGPIGFAHSTFALGLPAVYGEV